MRVLLVGDAESPHLRRVATGLSSRGHAVAAAGFGGPALPGVDLIDLGGGRARARYARAVPALRRAVREFAPDIVNAHFVSSYGVLADLAHPGVPVIQSAWGSDVLWLPRRHPWHRRLVTRALARAAAVTYDSDDVAALVAYYAPRTVRVRLLFGPEAEWMSSARHDERVVLSARRPEHFYNVDVVVDAFARVHRARPGWRLEILTYGRSVADLEAQVERFGLRDAVCFTPPLDRDALRERFLAAPVFCSVPSSDAAAASLLEGMAAGSYPIVSDLPANREWIADGINGSIVPERDADALAAVLATAMDSPALRHTAAVRNRTHIAEHASWDSAMDTVESVFATLVVRRPVVA